MRLMCYYPGEARTPRREAQEGVERGETNALGKAREKNRSFLRPTWRPEPWMLYKRHNAVNASLIHYANAAWPLP
jgi:hypothetical protein